MNELITRAYVAAEIRINAFKQNLRNFRNDERGVGAMVATIIIMLIVVLLAAVFWDEISKWFNGMMEKIFDNSNPDKFNKPEGSKIF